MTSSQLGGLAAFHELQRRFAELLPVATWMDAAAALELTSVSAHDPPRLMSVSQLEGNTLRVHAVAGAPLVHFSAFLDGTQSSRVIAYVAGVPIVHGVVAAVIRQRVERRMRTWGTPIQRQGVYVPLTLLSTATRKALAGTAIPIVDSAPEGTLKSPHPFALQDAAIHAVQDARETAECELAELWCGKAEGELFVDGSITGSERVATAARVTGVVKSHRTMYAEGEELHTILRLAHGERTSVFRITSPKRTPVASWYLRLREPSGHDPLFGLVRVESAEPRGASSKEIASRANEVSRWILAEALPLALPDGRWDKMVYGIRDCEEFLRAIQ